MKFLKKKRLLKRVNDFLNNFESLNNKILKN